MSSTLSLVSFLSFFFPFSFLSLTNQLYHILSLSVFSPPGSAHSQEYPTQASNHTHAGAPRGPTHTHTLAHEVRSAQPLSDTFTPLAPIFSHFSFSASSPFSSPRCLAPHLRPQPPPHIDLFLFIGNAVVPMATSQLLIAKVLHIKSCNYHKRCAHICVCVLLRDESRCGEITCGQAFRKGIFRGRRTVCVFIKQ